MSEPHVRGAAPYGYSADELYFRLLGRHGLAWGYTDKPPLLPLMVRAFSALFGDMVLAIRIPAALCAGIIVTLSGMITAALGGRGRVQLLTALGLGTSTVVLSVGHAFRRTPWTWLARPPCNCASCAPCCAPRHAGGSPRAWPCQRAHPPPAG